MRTFLGALVVALTISLAACGDRQALAPIVEPSQVLLEFEGWVRDGQVTIRPIQGARGFDGIDSNLEQPLVRVREDKNGVPGTASALDGIELVVERVGPYPVPQTVVGGCGLGEDSFELNVTVRNFFQTALSNVYTEINDLTPGHAICNSDGSTPNIAIDGAQLITANGLIRYGNLNADPDGAATAPTVLTPPPLGSDTTAQTMLWRFRLGTDAFSFKGRVVADVCSADCSPGTIANEGPATSVANAFPFGDTNGSVEAVLEGNDTVYVAGTFSAVGPRTGSAFSTSRGASDTGAALTPWSPVLGGSVLALAPDGQGGFFVGGTFTQVGNFARPRLVHVFNDGSVDLDFNPAANLTGAGSVRALNYDVATDVLWVGRSATPFLAAVKGISGSSAFALVQPNDQVFAIVQAGNVVALSGEFRNFGGINARDKVAVFNSSGVLQPFAIAINGNGTVSADSVATDGSSLWIGGEFTSINGVTRNRLAAATISNSALLAWNPNMNGTVRQLRLVPGATPVIVAGGTFTRANGTRRNRLAAINANPTVAVPVLRAWNPNVGNTVNELVVDGPLVHIGGSFTTVGGVSRASGLAAVPVTFDTAAAPPTPWNPISGASASHAFAVDTISDRLLVGGAFSFGGYVARTNVAAFNLSTGAVTPLTTNTDGSVRALALSGSTLFLGGTFTTVGGSARARVAAVDATSGALAAFSANVTGTSVEALATSATHLYLGGTYTAVNGSARANLARVDLGSGAFDAAWTTGAQNTVHAIAVDASGNDVFVGGAFTALNGGANNALRFARVSTLAPGSALTNYNVVGTDVRAIALSRGVAYIGGNFTSVLGTNRTRAAGLDLRTDSLLPSFAPAPNNTVESIAAGGPTVILGGRFTAVGASARNALAVVDGSTGAVFASSPIAGGTAPVVNATAIIGHYVVGGGVMGDAPIATAGTTALSVRSSFVVVNSD